MTQGKIERKVIFIDIVPKTSLAASHGSYRTHGVIRSNNMPRGSVGMSSGGGRRSGGGGGAPSAGVYRGGGGRSMSPGRGGTRSASFNVTRNYNASPYTTTYGYNYRYPYSSSSWYPYSNYRLGPYFPRWWPYRSSWGGSWNAPVEINVETAPEERKVSNDDLIRAVAINHIREKNESSKKGAPVWVFVIIGILVAMLITMVATTRKQK